MKIIDGTVHLEQSPWPGSIGDSMAETSRLKHLWTRLGLLNSGLDLNAFVTEKGYVRHPSAPYMDSQYQSWREDDTSGDQYLPFYLAATDEQKKQMRSRVIKNLFRYGNGDIIHPNFIAFMVNSQWLINLTTKTQLKLFDLKWRWSDEHNKFEPNEDSSGDYINFIHSASYASPEIRKKISPDKLIDKVFHYYKPEPNVSILTSLYLEFCFNFFGKCVK